MKQQYANHAAIQEEEIRFFIGMIIDQLARAPKSTKEYLKSFPHAGLSVNRWHKIIQCMGFDSSQWFTELNSTFSRVVQLPGSVTLDESIWRGKADWIFIREHPDKPIPLGLKVFTLAFRLPKTDRPYCYHFWPDLNTKCLSAASVLNLALAALPRDAQVVMTADRFFGSLDWALAHPEQAVIFNVNLNAECSLFSALEKDIPQGHYRVYKIRNALLSLFHDSNMMRVISTAHTTVDANTTSVVMLPPTAQESAGLVPRLTAPATVDLAMLKTETLQELAALFGESTSGTTADLISRISGRRLPLPALSKSPYFLLKEPYAYDNIFIA